MLASREVPAPFKHFNRVHRAPHGHPHKHRLRRLGHFHPLFLRRIGEYGWQTNNSIREFEYPWAFEQIQRLGSGLVIADIGASLAGIQYTLARAGHRVHAVDPGMNARGRGWDVDPDRHQQLARVFRAPVELHPTTLDQAGLPDQSLDVILSVSTIEHFGPGDMEEFLAAARRVLKPGGHMVLTIDLFLDLAPFTGRDRNEYGTNIDVAALLERAGGELVVGDPACLNGFPGFDPAAVQARLGEIAVGCGYPALAQCLVARVG